MSCTQTSLVARLRGESGYEMLSPRCGSSKMMLHFIYPYRLSASKHRWRWWDPAPNYRHQCDLRIGVNTVSGVSILPLCDTSHESCANLSIIRDSSDALRLLLLDNEASLCVQASECPPVCTAPISRSFVGIQCIVACFHWGVRQYATIPASDT